jgi:hypothetical protein
MSLSDILHRQAERRRFWREYHQSIERSRREVRRLSEMCQCEKFSKRQGELYEKHLRENPFRLEVEEI